MVFYPEFWIVFAAIAIVCSIGFKRYIWFISVGYGLSIATVGVCLFAIWNAHLDILRGIIALLLLCYGLRLGVYLLYREMRITTYNTKMKAEISDGRGMAFPIKIVIWLSCALLYLMMVSPILYRFGNNAPNDGWLIAGEIIMAMGILLEAFADKQKSDAKKKNSGRFCDTGLFRIVRCPNYLGELILWTGVLISGISVLQSVGQWIVAVIGYLGIVYVMFSGARRLELRQNRTYGSDSKYQEYIKKTPIILPFIPLYSVEKYKWLIA